MNKLTRNKAHRAKYAQLVNSVTKDVVVKMVGLTRLVESTDEHFNDIPLRLWDATAWLVPQGTLAERVCILKEAARQLVEEYHQKMNKAN